ncbi:Bcr/CflA family drug resistance efflux transporter (plasmid) [Rhizobium sp. ACO-34A]|nr:multidrug effflux MFS transporter [Rhizobium sp. ACO-34A]ATN37200.1 Bcr/CflA family drug resistance efflux transporter [Rhizobium sp. ACO-34A]
MLYLPAMPAMSTSLHADAGMVEFTISGYLVGFSFGQLFWGPISDRYGRRLPVALGLILFIIGSAGCALSGSVEAIIAWRIVQAVGACAGVVLARAMVRDLYEGHRAAQMLSTLMVVMAIAPLLGPILGGQIAAVAGWRAIFWVLVGVGLLTLLALFSLPETLPAERRRHEPLTRAFSRYGQLLTSRRILGYIGAGGFFYAGLYAYIAGSPFAFITYHHVPAQFYGLLFGAGIVGIVVSNLFNKRLVPRLGIEGMLVRGTVGAAVAAIVLGVTTFTDSFGLWGLFVPLLLFIACTGFIVANSIAGALADFSTEAGTVSALVGALQYGSGIAGSGFVGGFADGTPWPMGCVIALCGVGGLLSIILLRRSGSSRVQP